MKTKTKLLAALSAALAATAAVATTGTFAWFTTTRTATVNFTNTSVYNQAGNLKMKYIKVDSSTTNDSSSGFVTSANITGLAGSASANITDISGNGKTFYKPNWKPGSEGSVTSDTTATAITTNSETAHYFITFQLRFENDGSKGLDLYLNNETLLSAVTNVASDAPEGTADPAAWATAQNGKNTAALKATRVAFWSTSSAAESTLACVWQQDETDAGTGYKFLTADAAGVAYGATGSTVTGYTLSTVDPAKFHTGITWPAVQKGFTAANGQKLGTVAANDGTNNGYLVVTVSIWMEGSLSTCSNGCIGGRVSAAFKFAALDADA